MIHKVYQTKSLLRPEYWNIEAERDQMSHRSSYSNCSTVYEARRNTNTAPIYQPDQVVASKRRFVATTNQQSVYLRVSQNGSRSPKTQADYTPPSSSTESRSEKKETSNSNVGLAEQLRRSRESNTFALIDSELSKSPLGKIRDLYLTIKGVNCSNGNAPRTTKKANLSAVHAIVRFRIKEYLIEIREHSRKLAETLVSRDPNHNSVNELLAPLPCSKDCSYCDKFDGRLDVRRYPKKFISPPSPVQQQICPLVCGKPTNMNKNRSFSFHRNSLSSSPPYNNYSNRKINNNNNNSNRIPVRLSQVSLKSSQSCVQSPHNNGNSSNNNYLEYETKPSHGSSTGSNRSSDFSSPPEFPSPNDFLYSDNEEIFPYSSIKKDTEIMLTSIPSSIDEVPVNIDCPRSKRLRNDSFNPQREINEYIVDWNPCEIDVTQSSNELDSIIAPSTFSFDTNCDEFPLPLMMPSQMPNDEDYSVLV